MAFWIHKILYRRILIFIYYINYMEQITQPQLPEYVNNFYLNAKAGHCPYGSVDQLRQDREDMEITIHLDPNIPSHAKEQSYSLVRLGYQIYKQMLLEA